MELAAEPLPSRAPKVRSASLQGGPWSEFLERVLPPSQCVEAADDAHREAAAPYGRAAELPAE